MGEKVKSSLDRSDFLSFAALLFSMIAVFVSIYEARILKEQQLIMLSQEKTSVWPYVDGGWVYEYGEKVRIRYQIENKGIGPSKIRTMDLVFNSTPVNDYMTLVDSLQSYFPDIADLGVSYLPAEGEVLSPNEKIEVLTLECKRFPGDLMQVRDLKLQFDICYCSVYDDCWQIQSNDDGERASCN